MPTRKQPPTADQLCLLLRLVEGGYIADAEKRDCGYWGSRCIKGKTVSVWGNLASSIEASGLISRGLDRRNGVFGSDKKRTSDAGEYFIDIDDQNTARARVDFRSRVGSTIAVARIQWGLTQRGLTTALNLPEKNRTTVAHIEQGLLLPSLAIMRRLPRLLRLPLMMLKMYAEFDKHDKFLQARRGRKFNLSRDRRIKYKALSIDANEVKRLKEQSFFREVHGFDPDALLE